MTFQEMINDSVAQSIRQDSAFYETAISGLITYPAGLVRVLETHELNKF